ncbi:Cell division ATP-binding protein FtsE [Calidithermus roseus]|uniref:Cell division ATP-binding protein FtsE n=2 Tax=Calidithermus roseus TaxID=1644118 RepID=A0A399EX48_9DEIN|nr:Cell division ATP-binding protein FtsE [Calidithermus roseus]
MKSHIRLTPGFYTAAMIGFHRVTLEYARTQTKALYDINFEIKKGEFCFLVGHSGAGKSSLLSLLLKRLEPTSGAIYFGGENLRALRGDRIALHRRKIGVVFQDHRLLKDQTVEDNLLFALRVLGVPKAEWENRVTRVLRLVGLVHKKRSFPEELSVGESQRVAIARAIIGDPPVVLADEPTGNLDLTNAITVLEILKSIHARGATVIVATHSRELVEAYPQRVLVLKAGQLVRDDRSGKYSLS